MKKPRKINTVTFTHNEVEYENFDRARPYFVVKDGEIVSVHENYEDARAIAPYSGSPKAGRMGGPAMTTSEAGLRNQDIENPVPHLEPTFSFFQEEPVETIPQPNPITARWYRDLCGRWRTIK